MAKLGKYLAAAGVLAILTQGAASAEKTFGDSEKVSESEFYVLREWNGKIALLEGGAEDPLTVYNTDISSLYPADAELLREGIRVKTRYEVARLIEDLELE